MNALDEKRALDALVRMIVDRLEPSGEPASSITVAATGRGLFATSVDAFSALAVLERLGLIRQVFGVVVPGPAFAEVRARREAYLRAVWEN